MCPPGAVWCGGRSGHCGPGGAVPHKRCLGPCPRPPAVPPGDPCVTTVLFSTSTRLPQICSLPKYGLFLCAGLQGGRAKGAEVTARVGGIKDEPYLGLEGRGGAVSQAMGDSCFCPGGLPPGGLPAGGCARPAPRSGWKGARSAAPVCSPRPRSLPRLHTLPPPCPVPTSQDRLEEDAEAPRGAALWSGGPGQEWRGLHLPHPTPAARGLILSGGP